MPMPHTHVFAPSKDTLLNVFLAIAVDNLANAQELTAVEEAEMKIAAQKMENERQERLVQMSLAEANDLNSDILKPEHPSTVKVGQPPDTGMNVRYEPAHRRVTTSSCVFHPVCVAPGLS
ncbi:unnamed protein product [Schistocephalus solidus]|uniref:Uncharacterized protein n=1 Tax=Schistocephalus solidus TaxID=70667 RepID=A0A183T8I1_SCHSO|nr:unnamed protein product [Schistocephalus solidus]